ncbi:MAG TPA: J domain-containing protein [Dehalococcoidia bacterium]|jgi:hypothetical protein
MADPQTFQTFDDEDYYETLQVSPRADAEVIEAAYRVLARRYHPDRNRSPAATARMAQINAAWETLRDPRRRAGYDRARRIPAVRGRQAATAGAPGGASPVTAHSGESVATEEPADRRPRLRVEPPALRLGPLPRGARVEAPAAVVTEPPGIRVQVAVAEGAAWLTAGPPLLQGLEKEQIGLAARTRRLAPGVYRGAVALRTSWETVLLPVELSVRRASLLFALRALLREGPGEGGWRGGAGALLLSLIVLLAIAAGLTVLALGR